MAFKRKRIKPETLAKLQALQGKPCPGSKIRSKGQGMGLGIGQGRGPLGRR